jgi:sugar phosphate isomerase/epimerase
MEFNLCIEGNKDEIKIFPRLMEMNVGIELQSYGLNGVSSKNKWYSRMKTHAIILKEFNGRVIIHGPFLGIRYTYNDYLLRKAVFKRMQMTYKLVKELNPDIIVLHSGFSEEMRSFNLEDLWLNETANFWKKEIYKYEKVNTRIVIENIVEDEPSLLMELHDIVGSKFFGLCLDVGHTNIFSNLPIKEWISKMGKRLHYVHLHDNSGKEDEHLPVGRGNINFDDIFNKLKEVIPDVQVSLEVDDNIENNIENLEMVIKKYNF